MPNAHEILDASGAVVARPQLHRKERSCPLDLLRHRADLEGADRSPFSAAVSPLTGSSC